jgi:uncharacterized Zn-finger protein
MYYPRSMVFGNYNFVDNVVVTMKKTGVKCPHCKRHYPRRTGEVNCLNPYCRRVFEVSGASDLSPLTKNERQKARRALREMNRERQLRQLYG